jgi:hypothetical protein
MMKPTADYEGLGANFGIAGALLLALAIPASKWGWVLFLASNAFWLLFALRFGYRKLARQTVIFSGTSVLGIANTFYPGNAFQTWLASVLA